MTKEPEPGESEITYFDGKMVHSLCGKASDSGNDYLIVDRRDKRVQIYKKWIVTLTDLKSEDPNADS